MSWPEIFNVMITGIVVVFIALVLLILVVIISGKIFSVGGKKNKKTNSQPKVEASTSSKVGEVESGISDDVVAAITAAISCLMTQDGVTKPFAVRSIKRAVSVQNAWRFAGIMDNTQSF